MGNKLESLSSIGARGLVVFEAGKYYYVKEEKWRSNGAAKDAPKQVQAAQKLGTVMAQLENATYVDLDKLKTLEDGMPAPQKTRAWIDEQSIVFQESGKLFQIPRSDWSELDPGFEGDAGVIVTRGAVVAAIPSNQIPSGTYCVLVNLESLGL